MFGWNPSPFQRVLLGLLMIPIWITSRLRALKEKIFG